MDWEGKSTLFCDDGEWEEDDSEGDGQVVEEQEYGSVNRFNHCCRVCSVSYLGYIRISVFLSLFITNVISLPSRSRAVFTECGYLLGMRGRKTGIGGNIS